MKHLLCKKNLYTYTSLNPYYYGDREAIPITTLQHCIRIYH